MTKSKAQKRLFSLRELYLYECHYKETEERAGIYAKVPVQVPYLKAKALLDDIYTDLDKNKLITTKQTVANLSTHMKDGVEYEVIIREVQNGK